MTPDRVIEAIAVGAVALGVLIVGLAVMLYGTVYMVRRFDEDERMSRRTHVVGTLCFAANVAFVSWAVGITVVRP